MGPDLYGWGVHADLSPRNGFIGSSTRIRAVKLLPSVDKHREICPVPLPVTGHKGEKLSSCVKSPLQSIFPYTFWNITWKHWKYYNYHSSGVYSFWPFLLSHHIYIQSFYEDIKIKLWISVMKFYEDITLKIQSFLIIQPVNVDSLDRLTFIFTAGEQAMLFWKTCLM